MAYEHRKRSLEPYQLNDEKIAGCLTSFGGLIAALRLWDALDLDRPCQRVLTKERERGPADAEYIQVLVMLLLSGGKSISDVQALHGDLGLCRIWPAIRKVNARRLTDHLHRYHDERLECSRRGEALIPPETPSLQALCGLNHRLIAEAVLRKQPRQLTVELDASVHPSRKHTALRTYEGPRGYQPLIAYCPELDLILQDQFRDGNVPAGCSNLEVLQEVHRHLPPGVDKYFRADSALYEHKVLRWLDRQGYRFVVSADLSPQLREAIVALPEEDWRRYQAPRKQALQQRRRRLTAAVAEIRDVAEVEFFPSDDPARTGEGPFRYLALRIARSPDDQDLFDGPWKYLSLVTNRWDGDPTDLIGWHREKCGSVERAHDELKNDLGARVLPCEKFGANAAWYRLCTVAFNLASLLTSSGLSGEEWRTRRPATLQYVLLRVAAIVAHHARQFKITLAAQTALVPLLELHRNLSGAAGLAS